MILKNAYDICCTRCELKEKHAELQKTNNELEKFVYSASHDLRAPVLSIKGVINFALSQTKPKDQEYLLMIEKSINRLDVFVENIINYYQNVKLRVSPVEIRFDKMIGETWSSFNFIQNKSEIEFRSTINQEEVFKTDEFRMQVILNNLLLNAIKYQGKDNASQRISVDVHVANNMATVSVSDTGIGIEPEHMDKIFNMFYRATQEKPGSGLGLYIVRKAVDKIDGAIAVKSVVGKGSTFTVTIPGRE
jgi:signal transduction histidine kinase